MQKERKILIVINDDLLRHRLKYLVSDSSIDYVVSNNIESALSYLSDKYLTHIILDLEWGRDIYRAACMDKDLGLRILGVSFSGADIEEFKMMGVDVVKDSDINYEKFSDWIDGDVSEDNRLAGRRKSPRISAKGWVIDGDGNTAKLLDLSAEGAKIEFVGLEDFELNLDNCTVMPMLGVKTQLDARAVWRRQTEKPGGLEVGLSFAEKLSFYN